MLCIFHWSARLTLSTYCVLLIAKLAASQGDWNLGVLKACEILCPIANDYGSTDFANGLVAGPNADFGLGLNPLGFGAAFGAGNAWQSPFAYGERGYGRRRGNVVRQNFGIGAPFGYTNKQFPSYSADVGSIDYNNDWLDGFNYGMSVSKGRRSKRPGKIRISMGVEGGQKGNRVAGTTIEGSSGDGGLNPTNTTVGAPVADNGKLNSSGNQSLALQSVGNTGNKSHSPKSSSTPEGRFFGTSGDAGVEFSVLGVPIGANFGHNVGIDREHGLAAAFGGGIQVGSYGIGAGVDLGAVLGR